MNRSKLPVVAATVLGLGLALVAFAPSRAPQWQYTVVRGAGMELGANDAEIERIRVGSEQRLNSLGKDGWEFVQYINGFAVLKRLK
jgi:hypothetical protein